MFLIVMHILIITSCFARKNYPVMGNFILNQAVALQKRGHTIGILHDNWLMPCEIIEKLLSPKKFFKFITFRVVDDIPVVDVKSWFGFPIVSRFLTKFRIRRAVQAYKVYCKKYGKPDVLHAHFDSTGGLIAKKLSDMNAIPYGITEHASKYLTSHIKGKQQKVMQSCWKNAHFRVAVSMRLKAVLQELYDLEKGSYPVEVIPNALNSSFFENLPVSVGRGNPIVLCTVCNLIKRKSVDLLLRSFYLFVKECPSAKFIIVGDGPERNNLVKLANELNISQNVFFKGSLSSLQVRDVMDASDVFVLASTHETFGVVCAEAHARGLPVVVTDCGGVNDIVNSKNGLIVKSRDYSDFAKSISTVFHNLNNYDRQRIQQECVEKYSCEIIACKLEDVYSILSTSL